MKVEVKKEVEVKLTLTEEEFVFLARVVSCLSAEAVRKAVNPELHEDMGNATLVYSLCNDLVKAAEENEIDLGLINF